MISLTLRIAMSLAWELNGIAIPCRVNLIIIAKVRSSLEIAGSNSRQGFDNSVEDTEVAISSSGKAQGLPIKVIPSLRSRCSFCASLSGQGDTGCWLWLQDW